MKIYYHCELCGMDMAVLDLDYIDERKLGFDRLTSEERAAIINKDMLTNTLHVKSLCDRCIAQRSSSEAFLAVAAASIKYRVH